MKLQLSTSKEEENNDLAMTVCHFNIKDYSIENDINIICMKKNV